MNARSYVVSQFQNPRGAIGLIVGQILAHRPSNVTRNRWTIQLLDVQPGDRVVELGIGPGRFLAEVGELIPRGSAVGIDHSKTMVAMARRYNRRTIADGRVAIHHGEIENALALAGGPADKVFAVNALPPSPTAQLATLLHVLLYPGGRLAITFQSRRPGAGDADSQRIGEQYAGELRRAGFDNLRIETLPLRPACAVCVLANRRHGQRRDVPQRID